MREAERSASGEYSELKGDLVVTTSLILGRQYVLPIVAEFLKVNPAINVQLLLANRIVNPMEEHVDLAVQQLARQQPYRDLPGLDPARRLRQPHLLYRTWYSQDPRRTP